MRKLALPLLVCATLIPAALTATPAGALSNKTWVSGSGADVVGCGPVTNPCGTFQHAHDLTAPGGEIGVLSPGDYGPVVISKSISIINDGAGEAGIQITIDDSYPIVVQAGKGDVVTLRGLILDGYKAEAYGLWFQSGSALHIQNCIIRNFNNPFGPFGILIANYNGPARVFISDTLISNNGNGDGGAHGPGIRVAPSGDNTAATVVLNRVRLIGNGTGLYAGSTAARSSVIIRNSEASLNGEGLIAANDASTGQFPAFLFVKSSTVAHNNTGIFANGGTVLMSKTTVTRNNFGIFSNGGGQIISYSDNDVDNNDGPDGAPTNFRTLR